jgi:hypothetical protein
VREVRRDLMETPETAAAAVGSASVASGRTDIPALWTMTTPIVRRTSAHNMTT